MKHMILSVATTLACSAVLVIGQTQPPPQPAPTAPPAQTFARPASPVGTSATQVAGTWGKNARGGDVYQNGKWIEISYGRPIMRGRDVWGTGPDYAKGLLINGAKVWRAGANVSTRHNSELPLQIGGKTIPAGEYSLFIDTKSPTDWTLIVSSWGAKKSGSDQTPDTIWGSFNYTPDKDVARAPMTLGKLPVSFDELTWNFVDMKTEGGKLAIMWDTLIATTPFTLTQ
ncbi:MAG: DUF2911 domain-containing protein [Vicinamibacterales bacterium]